MEIVRTAKIQLFARSNYIGGDGIERMREKNARRGERTVEWAEGTQRRRERSIVIRFVDRMKNSHTFSRH